MTTKSKSQEKHKMSEIDENISKLFDIKKRLGKGAYGIVWKALDKRNNETVAVKKIFDAFRDETDAQRTFREIVFLKALRHHPNIVKLHNVYKAQNNLDIYLIFEYMESDLHNIIKKGTILKDIHKRYIMYQLINAIKYIHSGNVIHRDLKPSNVLIDSKCRCKLADFGLARSVSNVRMRVDSNDLNGELSMEPILTDYVATRWYRAPEILIASKRYTKGIDMWSLGCILGEMIRGKPLFQGSSTVNQIEKIVSTLPDITEDDIKAVGAGFGSVLLKKHISKDKKTTFSDLLNDASKDALDLVRSLLVLDPLGRLTAKQALCHPYVEKFRNSIPEMELDVDIIPPFRDDIRLSVPEYRSKLYEIAQIPGEKRSENKTTQSSAHDKSDMKKVSKQKHVNGKKITSDDKHRIGATEKDMPNQDEISRPTPASSTPSLVKRKFNKSTNNISAASEAENHKTSLDDRQRNKSQANLLHRPTTNNGGIPRNSTNLKVPNNNSYKLYRSSSSLNKVESNKSAEYKSYSTVSMTTSSPLLNEGRSETCNATKSPASAKTQERICYERRLQKLEDEIRRYKNEVKSFCRDTFNYSKQNRGPKTSETQLIPVKQEPEKDARNYHKHNQTRKPNSNLQSSANTPIKSTYFQLLTKGKHNDTHQLLSGGRGDQFIPIDNFSKSHLVVVPNKDLRKYETNNHTMGNGDQIRREQQEYHMLHKQTKRSISKFI
ncbi:mitogen-activated protein kinase 15 isoform X2 [Musca domestica]|uniref:Mitogen-activated protein kinase n=1 Tax=Musca domestica TaxID=7370 RepID=A0ABM3UVV2_MUSDO|nr:mitogen-activated protein kinase 15 isoform X2 [Musca domestica]